jgi:hemolysin-activating ACP:hemolysin acyltransferase
MSLVSLERMLDTVGRGAPAPDPLAVLVGLCVPRWIERGVAPGQPLRWHLARLLAAAAAGRARALFDGYGRHAGTFIWTCLDDAAQAAMLSGGPDAIDAGAQAAQGQAWMLDFDARYGLAPALLRHARATLAARHADIAYVRIKGRRRVAKQVTLEPRAPAPQAAPPFKLAGQLLHDAAADIDAAARLGECCLLLAAAPAHGARPLAEIGAALCLPLALGQSVAVRTDSGRLAGMLTYAWLTGDGRRRLAAQGPRALSPSCLNEGATLVGLCGWADGADASAALGRALAGLHPALPRVFHHAGLPPAALAYVARHGLEVA